MANSALRAPLVQIMRENQPEERLQRVWLGIRQQRDMARHAGFWSQHARLIMAAATASCLVIVAAWLLRFSHAPNSVKPIALAVPANIEPGNAAREVDFGDGARVNVHAGARLDVLEQSDRAVVLALRHGSSQFDIRPGGARRWRIESAGVTVEVVGTRFSVERSETSVQVVVQRGRVLVRGANVPDEVQSLDAGKSMTVNLATSQSVDVATSKNRDEAAPESRARPTQTEPKAAAATTAARAVDALPAAAAASPSGDWHNAVTRQDWNQAWQSLGEAGVAREAAHTDDVADLLALADVARLSGHPQQALAPLRQIVGNHSEDPRSAMAAFTLGRVLLDALGQPVQASFAFERALTLKLPASLAEDALARLVEAHAKAGASGQARAAANTYRASYPSGRRLADVNRWSPAE